MSDKNGLVLVTGANGFLGSHLVEALLQQGYSVRCMVRRSSDLTYIQNLPVEWAYADLANGEGLQEACLGVQAICHCAALTRAPDRNTFMRVNAQGTEALARACLEASPSLHRFLHVSSLAAGGPSQGMDQPQDEVCVCRDDTPRPVTWYGESKLAAEQALLEMRDHLPLTIVRPAAVFGPRDRDFFTYFELINRGLDLQLGSEARYVSLIYVHDLVQLLILALEGQAAEGQSFCGSNQAHSHSELSAAIALALGKRPRRITLPVGLLTPIAWYSRALYKLTGHTALLNDQRVRDLRQPYWICSGEKAREELGFAPQYDLQNAVQQTANWYRDNGWL
jgi:nucleoside-diphosphate-sugar epimerase